MVDETLRRARAGLTQVIEPADSLGTQAAQTLGPVRLLEIIQGATPSQADWKKVKAQDEQRHNTYLQRNLGSALDRWRRRSKYLHPAQALDFLTRIEGEFLTPEDPRWPIALADLGDTEPLGLWVLGNPEMQSHERCLSLVGSREATAYGQRATAMLVSKAIEMKLTTVSGGAYGIDAIAHQAALQSAPLALPTVAVLAGGLDKFYPAGNVALLEQVAGQGTVITEMPPGMRPNRFRFLNRNRLIAALSAATIVVEARYRSGALSTANHAHDLGRHVGAVPGPINVPSSAGCHRLLKETPALLIDDPADLQALYGDLAEASITAEQRAETRSYDGLDMEELLVFDALPINTHSSIEHLCGLTGLPVPRIAGILAKLERHRLAEQQGHGWCKASNTIDG